MPYKFEHEHLKIKDKDDRRIKLFDEDREEIRKLYATGLFSQRDLANRYNVSRRTITFVLDPTKRERANELLKQRKKDGRYYSKEKQREYVKKYREHKYDLYKQKNWRRYKTKDIDILGIVMCIILVIVAFGTIELLKSYKKIN